MDLSKKLFSLLILFLSLNSQALDCRIVEKFSDPKFANNTKFWNELGQLENQTDDAVAALIKKHDTQFKFSGSTSTPKHFSIPQSFNISKKSEKAMKTFSPTQQRNFEEFVSTVGGKDGVKALYNNPGKWHFEKLKQYGGNSSIRLDQGMRVLFKVDGDAIEIIDVGKHIGH